MSTVKSTEYEPFERHLFEVASWSLSSSPRGRCRLRPRGRCDPPAFMVVVVFTDGAWKRIGAVAVSPAARVAALMTQLLRFEAVVPQVPLPICGNDLEGRAGNRPGGRDRQGVAVAVSQPPCPLAVGGTLRGNLNRWAVKFVPDTSRSRR